MASLQRALLGAGISVALVTLGACSGENGSSASGVSSGQTASSTGQSGSSSSGQGGSGQGGSGQGGSAAGEFPQPPCGIFVLSSAKAGFSKTETRDYPFVDGLVLRMFWTDFAPSAGVFNFTDVDAAISAIAGLGQKLSIQIIGEDPPYVAANATDTWIWFDTNPNHAPSDCNDANGCIRPLPWDPAAIAQHKAAVQALASHIVDTGSGPVPLSEHPNVAVVQIGLPGWSRIREIDFNVEAWPGYTRSKLIKAVTDAFDLQVAAFPHKPLLVGFWDVPDGVMQPAFWEDMNNALLGRYTGPTGSRLGYFQENLYHGVTMGVDNYGPATTYAKPLFAAKDKTYIGLQMLTSWTNPFTGPEKVAGGNPYQAVSWANQTYNARYFEIYPDDTDTAVNSKPAWLDGLNAVHQSLGCTP